jgi:hypothetical protein
MCAGVHGEFSPFVRRTCLTEAAALVETTGAAGARAPRMVDCGLAIDNIPISEILDAA